ncbi:hypothetical protein CYMTET_36834 [Cymbomonas tetramitiformis]|uniref:Uncharacterized protein n=1 Tax=Cymbomonas tetramitiformis TaxID=36881 RepID=A0AAE0CF58_9CHLO|nr:hypothetical protein CYMTET_36834 [Cymbomonas tetramitiformis]
MSECENTADIERNANEEREREDTHHVPPMRNLFVKNIATCPVSLMLRQVAPRNIINYRLHINLKGLVRYGAEGGVCNQKLYRVYYAIRFGKVKVGCA